MQLSQCQRALMCLAVLAGAPALGCIIPDLDISIESELENPGAVRIVERPFTHPQMDEYCNVPYETIDMDEVRSFADMLSFCPQTPPPVVPSGFIRPQEGAFCVCPGEDSRDTRAITAFDIFAEDPTWERTSPRDTLYGVLLLDPDSTSDTPQSSVAYENYLAPCEAGEWVEETEFWPKLLMDNRNRRYGDWGQPTEPDRGSPSEGRNVPAMWRFRIEDAGGRGSVDLCNLDNYEKLSPGLHSLEFLVTDRPFFRPVREDGTQAPPQCGVPDIAAGATYAVRHWVFECLDGSSSENAEQCACQELP